MTSAICRSCGASLALTVCDLGLAPISNAFIWPAAISEGEIFYPLRACVCEVCWLVQLDTSLPPDAHFHADYVYFSSYSSGWIEHARRYVKMATARFGLSATSRVMEVASNDGYLLQFFLAEGIPALGIEPSANTAAAARERGVETRSLFFGEATARQLVADNWQVDLLVGNNVLAHVPDINDFVRGIRVVLSPSGIATLEFPHVLNLLADNQFDTIYHEHYTYLSLIALLPVFQRGRLRVFDVEKLNTHGGSLRLYVCHDESSHHTTQAVSSLALEERQAGLTTPELYDAFAEQVIATKHALLAFLIDARSRGHSVAAYGAAAKGNTLINYCGIRNDMIQFVVDRNPSKQGRMLPGSRIPVLAPEQVEAMRPDFLLILPWNLQSEIAAEMSIIRSWGGRFVVPIPRLLVF